MLNRLSRRSLLKAAACLGTGAGLALLGLGSGERSKAQEESEAPYFRESATKLTLGNQYYEVDFDKQNGAIIRIFDMRGGGVVSEGNADESLWSLFWNEDQHWIGSGYLERPRFRSDWNGHDTLTMSWNVQSRDVEAVVSVTVKAHAEPYIDLTTHIDWRRGQSPDQFGFLNNLVFLTAHLRNALLPYMGGVLLGPSFFSNNRGLWPRYPSWGMMADFLWLETIRGTLSVHTLFGDSRSWLAEVNLYPAPTDAVSQYRWHHWFQVALTPANTEAIPTVRVLVGEGKEAALTSYRQHNTIGAFSSVREKAGDLYGTISRSPISAQSIDEGTPPSWTAPTLLHPTLFQEQDFEEHNPDWWPPAERLGGAQAYRAVFGAAQRDGSLIMPYTNPTAGHEQSLTAQQLRREGLSLDDIAVRDRRGESVREEHGYWTGTELLGATEIVRLSPSHPWYVRRLDEIMAPNTEAGNDLIYFDQIGALTWYYDAQPTAASPLEWSQAWLDHMRRFDSVNPVVEGFWDRLAMSAVIGTYSALYGEVVEQEDHWIFDIETYYPVAASLFRDKTLQYAHNLEGITGWRWSGFEQKLETIDVFRWHLMMGQSLSIDQEHLRGASEWGAVVTTFSHFVLGRHADDLLESFEGSSRAVAVSRFASYTVVANATNDPYTYDQHTITARGVGIFAHDDSITAGVFQSYNNRALSRGEHYLVEQRKRNGVIVRQPMGDSTTLRLMVLPNWRTSSPLKLRAFNRSHHLLSARSASVDSGAVEVQYESAAASAQEWQTFRASISLGETNVEDGLREVNLPWTTTQAVIRGGRHGRIEVQQTSAIEQRHGFVSFQVARDLLKGRDEANCEIEVEWWDGLNVDEVEHPYLWPIYDGVVQSGDGAFSVSPGVRVDGDQQWKTSTFSLDRALFRKRVWDQDVDVALIVPEGVAIGKVIVTNADELERRTVAYYTIHDPTQGETLTQGLHLRGWTDATQPIADLDLNGLQAIYAWDAEASSWLLYSPDVPARFNTLDTLEQGRAYYVRVRNGQTLHWPDAPYGGVGFHLQPGRNLVCWLGTSDKPLTEAIAPLRGMKAQPLVSVTLNDRIYDVEESRTATDPLPYGQPLWVEIEALGPTRWLQF